MIKKHADLGANIIVLIIERLLQMVLSIACVGFMAKSLSIHDNGQFAYAYSLAAVLVTLSYFAGSELITSKLSKYKFIQKNVITTGFYLRVMFGIICIITSLLFAFLYIDDKEVRLTFFLAIIGPLVGESVYIFGCWFTANRLNFWFSITRALGLLGRFFTILYLSKCTWVKMHHFNYAYILEAFLIGSTTAFLYFKHPKSPSWGKFDRVIFKSLFRDGILIGIGLVLYYLFLRFDRILLEKMVHSDSLGLYTTVIQLNDAWLNIGIMVCSILGPYFIFNCRDNKIAQKRLYKMIFVILPISALICIIMPVMSPFLITNILGEKYKNGVNLFNLSCWLSLFVFANQIFSLWWLKQKSYINQIIVWILGILIMFFTRNIFVVNYDIYGMIYASFLAYAVMLVYQFVYIRLK